MNNKFNYKWFLKDAYYVKGIKKNKYNVFGTFICGGGSTMGYKLAGFNHLGGVEIDPKIADVYKINHNPKYLFIEDIREFIKRIDLPAELFELDILDGSPPCSSFSMAGNREKDWGRKKVFREGQAKQRLDDLFFDYIKLAEKLQPKIVIAENVKGMLHGNAKTYIKRIKTAFENAGYKVQLFLLNAASMGVPQKRERIFFICQRKDLNYDPLALNFNEKPILFKNIKEQGKGKKITGKMLELWLKKNKNEKDLAGACQREYNQRAYFGTKIQHDNDVPFTVIASSSSPIVKNDEPLELSKNELCKIGSYPLDYIFSKIEPKYLIGMSVPPVMMANIAYEIKKQWLDRIGG